MISFFSIYMFDDLDEQLGCAKWEGSVQSFKAILSYQGIECYSPRSCIKEAFKAKIIPDDKIVLDMLEDRNRSSHVYDEEESWKIFEIIKRI